MRWDQTLVACLTYLIHSEARADIILSTTLDLSTSLVNKTQADHVFNYASGTTLVIIECTDNIVVLQTLYEAVLKNLIELDTEKNLGFYWDLNPDPFNSISDSQPLCCFSSAMV